MYTKEKIPADKLATAERVKRAQAWICSQCYECSFAVVHVSKYGSNVHFCFVAVYFTQHTWTATFSNVGREPAMIFTSSFA